MTEEKFNNELEKIRKKNAEKEQKVKLREEKSKYKNKKKPSASKLILLGVILLCFEIVAFCEYAMLHLGDTSALYALIGVPVALAPTCIGYFQKSKAENTEGGIIYDTAMAELNKEEQQDEFDIENEG